MKTAQLGDIFEWNYDVRGKEWYVGETVAWANDGFSIRKDGKKYQLDRNHSFVGMFKKLSNAKTVAYLLRHG